MISAFNRISMLPKILAAVGLTVGLVLAANSTLFVREYRKDAELAMVEKAAAFTATADEAKNHASRLSLAGVYDQKLIDEAVQERAAGKPITQTRAFSTIPVVVGWTAAREAAKREGLEFKILAFDARNPLNEPEHGSFRAQLLKDLVEQFKAGGQESIARVDPATNNYHYLRAIKLDASCMTCHGDPAVHGPKGRDGKPTGKDPLGYVMENWKPGDMHGAYEVVMPMAKVDQQVAGFLGNGMLVCVPLLVGALAALYFMLRTTLSAPVHALVAMLKEIATGDGDLTKRLNIQRGDEIGQLAKWFDAFVDNVHQIVRQVAGTTKDVAAAATQIAASAEQVAQGLKHQQDQTAQVSAAVEEMSQSVVEVAKKSAEASGTAQDSGKQAAGGGEVVQRTVTEIKAIASQVGESAVAVSNLGKRSEQIGQIIGVINDIADQTNLLALNAAIEAARAGEHGRGFAVVADEVRKLAERTTQATEEVAKSIREIQNETGVAVQKIQAGSASVNTGVQLAEEAGQSLRAIVASSTNVQSMVQSIAAAAEEQSAASEQIARSVEQINVASRESTEGSRQSAQAAAMLSQQAERLQSLVSRFKV